MGEDRQISRPNSAGESMGLSILLAKKVRNLLGTYLTKVPYFTERSHVEPKTPNLHGCFS